MRRYGVVGFLFLGVLLFGCAREEKAWQKATSTNNVAAYQQHLRLFPKGVHSVEAQAKAEQLAWGEAVRKDNIAGYKEYLGKFFLGKNAPAALNKVDHLEYIAATEVNTVEVYRQYVKEHPKGAHVPQAKTSIQIMSEAKYRPLAARARALEAKYRWLEAENAWADAGKALAHDDANEGIKRCQSNWSNPIKMVNTGKNVTFLRTPIFDENMNTDDLLRMLMAGQRPKPKQYHYTQVEGSPRIKNNTFESIWNVETCFLIYRDQSDDPIDSETRTLFANGGLHAGEEQTVYVSFPISITLGADESIDIKAKFTSHRSTSRPTSLPTIPVMPNLPQFELPPLKLPPIGQPTI